MKKYLFVFGVMSILVLSGCGGGHLLVKSDAINNTSSIALIEVPEHEYRMMDLGSPAAALGSIGAVAVVVNGASTQKSLDGVLSENDYSFNKRLTNEIRDQLEKSGFKVKVVDVEREKNEIIEDYTAVNIQDSDVVLDVVVNTVGYVTEHFMFSPEWRPEAQVFVSMYSKKLNEVIYKETFMYGYHNPLMSATDIDAPKKYLFKTKEALFESGDKVVVAGLDDVVKTVASHVAARLRGGSL
jgi:hypothetical protein